MAQITNYGELKNKLTNAYMFHPRLLAHYDLATTNFERAANRRLRLRQMETVTDLSTTDGSVTLPTDYLVWRSVLYTGYSPNIPLDYVHPEYLESTAAGIDGSNPQLFTIEGSTFKTRPVNDTADAYEFHYYQKIPTITDADMNANWLLLEYPDLYLFGALTELFAMNRNLETAQLYKARRDELFAEIIQLSALTTGATSPTVRVSEYF